MARAVLIYALAAALSLAVATACSSRLRSAPLGAHPTADCATAVPSPPPEPVQVDEIGQPSDPRQVWVDGHWAWKNRRWHWEKGSWQLPPPGGFYARPALVRVPVAVYSGTGRDRVLKGYAMALMAYPGHWHLPSGQVAAPPPLLPPDAGSGPDAVP